MKVIVLCLILLISCAHAALVDLQGPIVRATEWKAVLDLYEGALQDKSTTDKEAIALDLFGFIISGKAGLTQLNPWRTIPIDRGNKKETDREKLRSALRTAARNAKDLRPFETLYRVHSSDHAQACWTIFTQAYGASRAASATPVPSTPAPSGGGFLEAIRAQGAKLKPVKKPQGSLASSATRPDVLSPLAGVNPNAALASLKKTGSRGMLTAKQTTPLSELAKKLKDQEAKVEKK